jgi:predicted DCC family thiol-disulfide oxidoreductase YuxK
MKTEQMRRWIKPLESRYGLDIRSLALLRMGLALVILSDLWLRGRDLLAHYSDRGVLPRALLADLWEPGYWSLHALSGAVWAQVGWFAIATVFAFLMLVGYRTRIATIASWILLISLHNRNPLLIFAADDTLRAILFWAMFLPLGASYSIDQALNTSHKPHPQRILTGATLALMAQQCFIYMFSAFFKNTSPDWWPDGTAVYYALSFDQYVTPLGHFLLNLGPLLVVFTWVTLVLEWVGPLLIWSPLKTDFCRMLAVVLFILLHVGFGLTLNIGIFPALSSFTWLAFIPTATWESWAKRAYHAKQLGLRIYYDADCGFCKKMVYLIRTFLVLPANLPLRTAQSDPDIHTAMLEQNSWVVVDWQGQHHYKWDGVVYVISLSPVYRPLARLLRWRPVMGLGTRFYETIANNRQVAGTFTKPLQFKPFRVNPRWPMTVVALVLLCLTFIWNLRSITQHFAFIDDPSLDPLRRITTSRTLQRVDGLSRVTRLDQSWSIFSPSPPKDDGWYVGVGDLESGGDPVNILDPRRPISFEKPTLKERQRLYYNMQWRTFFINLRRQRGQKALPDFGRYLCERWPGQPLKQVQLYFMNERTVPPGEPQTVEQEAVFTHRCHG